MSLKLLLLAIPAVALAAGTLMWFRPRMATRPLREFGQITLPARLDPYNPEERQGYAMFPFDRTSNAFWLMGSSRPIPEKLVLGVWLPASKDAARQSTIYAAGDHVENIKWRTEGAYRIGEGIARVNASEYPAWIVERDFDEKSVTLAYMVWKKDGSVETARQIVDQAGQSLQVKTAAAEYIQTGMDRPAKLAEARLKEMEATLAARGVHLTLDAGPVEKDGSIYELYTDWGTNRLLSMIVPIGDLPHADRFRHLRPQPPNGLGPWLDVIYYEKEDAVFERHTIDEGRKLSPKLNAWIDQHMAASPIGVAHFYAVSVAVIDASDVPPTDLNLSTRNASTMAALFRQGKLIQSEAGSRPASTRVP